MAMMDPASVGRSERGVRSILVICEANVGGSPIAERLLRQRLPGLVVGSAGLAAIPGRPVDPWVAAAAEAQGISLADHAARPFSLRLAAAFDLLLVMEPGQRHRIGRSLPQLLGRIRLFDRWTEDRGIPDPRPEHPRNHEQALRRLVAASDAWAAWLTSAGPHVVSPEGAGKPDDEAPCRIEASPSDGLVPGDTRPRTAAAPCENGLANGFPASGAACPSVSPRALADMAKAPFGSAGWGGPARWPG